MKIQASSVQDYLAQLPDDRRKALAAVRKVIRANLGKGYAEGLQYGMIGYFVPHSGYPAGYHCDPKQPLPFASLASQKNHMALYLFCVYCDAEEQKRFAAAWKESGKRLDMGKGCVRFRKLEDVPLDVLGRAIRRIPVAKFISSYEASFGPKGRPAAKKTAKKAAKKAAKETARKAPRKVARKAAKRVTQNVAKKAAQRPRR